MVKKSLNSLGVRQKSSFFNKTKKPNKKPQTSFTKNLIRKKNPDIFHFSRFSKFIYEPTKFQYYYNKYTNARNIFKPSHEEKEYLNQIIEESKNKNSDNKIYVFRLFKDIMDKVLKPKPILDKRDLIIKSIIDTSIKNENISIKKLKEKYNLYAEINGLKKIGLSLTHRIMRKKLLLKFRKKTVKSKKLNEFQYIKYTFFF